MKATEKQINMICYQMSRNKMPTDIPISFIEQLELGDASIIIKHFVEGRPEAGYNQLKHLFLNK